MFENFLKEICGKCGKTFGSHHGGSYDKTTGTPPNGYCPGTEGGMDWENGPGTCFESTGEYKGDLCGKLTADILNEPAEMFQPEED